MGDSDRLATFSHLVGELGKRRIAFICAREAPGEDSIGPKLKKAFGGIWIANERFDKAAARGRLAAGEADAVAFGKAFIANPDLPRRFALGAPLNKWNSETFYTAGPRGLHRLPRRGLKAVSDPPGLTPLRNRGVGVTVSDSEGLTPHARKC